MKVNKALSIEIVSIRPYVEIDFRINFTLPLVITSLIQTSTASRFHL